jgi:hypothetical protein
MWRLHKTGPWPGCYLAPDTGAEGGGGEGAGDGAAADPGAAGAAAGTDAGTETPEQREARIRAEASREVDRYRNEAGQANRELKKVQDRLREIDDAQKPELQRLTEQAGKVPTLEERLTRYEAAFQQQNGEARRILEKLDKDLLGLVPDGLAPEQEFVCLRNAVAKAMKDQEARQQGQTQKLPPAGGRNPGTNGKQEPTDKEKAMAAEHYQSRF